VAVLVEVLDGQRLHLGEHARAHPVQKALRDARHQLRVDGRGREADEIQADHDGDGACDLACNRAPAVGEALHDVGGDLLDIDRGHDADHGAQNDADDRDGQHAGIVAEENLQKPAHDALFGVCESAGSDGAAGAGSVDSAVSHSARLPSCSGRYRPPGRFRWSPAAARACRGRRRRRRRGRRSGRRPAPRRCAAR